MPKKTKIMMLANEAPAVTDAAPSDAIQISRAELASLIADSAKAAVTAAMSNKSDGTAMAEAFAAAIAPVLERSSANQKLVVDSVLDKTGRNVNDMASWVNISVFNPLGERDHPRPKLVDRDGKYRKTLFCGCDMGDHIERMTAEEINAFNAIEESCEVKNRTGWVATVSRNGSSEVLDIRLPMGDNDRILHLPSQLEILYEFKHNRQLPNAATLLNKMIAQASDPDAFIANLQRLLEQPVPAAV